MNIQTESIATTAIQSFREGRLHARDDVLAVEEPLEVRLRPAAGKTHFSVSVTMRTPGHDAELAAGFLFTEGLLASPDAVQEIVAGDAETEGNVVTVWVKPGVPLDTHRLLRHFYTSSSCGVCGKASLDAVRVQLTRDVHRDPLQVPASLIASLPDRLRAQQSLFQQTGGLHASWLCDASGALLAVREDVGRHNALDKVIGAEFLAGRLPLVEHILVLSGRASFELLQKAAMAGIPMVVAVGAPSTLAVKLAEETGITLIGFTRAESFNVYTGSARVLL